MPSSLHSRPTTETAEGSSVPKTEFPRAISEPVLWMGAPLLGTAFVGVLGPTGDGDAAEGDEAAVVDWARRGVATAGNLTPTCGMWPASLNHSTAHLAAYFFASFLLANEGAVPFGFSPHAAFGNGSGCSSIRTVVRNGRAAGASDRPGTTPATSKNSAPAVLSPGI